MNAAHTLRLGTRPSLLAVAQSRLIQASLEAQHPDLRVELITLDTRGDRDQQTPLTDIKDPDFFSAELDRALLEKAVDFCVHSYKDLSRTRPTGIVTAAIPQREAPHDVVMFRPDIRERLASGEALRIGSSSLRRHINIGDALPALLPGAAADIRIEFTKLRGPVHQRLKRIAADADERLDGVVLALAGLNRLCQDADGRRAIQHELREARRMVLPLSLCPVAPGQGALAIECRQQDPQTREWLAALHDPVTAQLSELEQALLEELPATDTSGYGATAIPHPELGFVAHLRGRDALDAEQTVEECFSEIALTEPQPGSAWDSAGWSQHNVIERLDTEPPTSGAVFVAHWRALDKIMPQPVDDPTLRHWTSGVMSWRKLAERGIWVEGCTDNLGYRYLQELLTSPALDLPPFSAWTALTHADAVGSWDDSGVGQCIGTYTSRVEPTDELRRQLAAHRHFYWSSPQQFEKLREWLPVDAQHACGAGKTLHALRAAGIDNPLVFRSRKEWQRWLG